MHIYLKMSYYVLKLSLKHIPAVSISFQESYMEKKKEKRIIINFIDLRDCHGSMVANKDS